MRTIKSFETFIGESINYISTKIGTVNETQIVQGIELNPSSQTPGQFKGKFYVDLSDDKTSFVGLDTSDPNTRVSINLYGGDSSEEKKGIKLDKNSEAQYFSWMSVDDPLKKDDEKMYFKSGKLEDLKNPEKATQLLGTFIIRSGIYSNKEMMKSLFKSLNKLNLSYDQAKNNKAYRAFFNGILNTVSSPDKAFASLDLSSQSKLKQAGLIGDGFKKLWYDATKA